MSKARITIIELDGLDPDSEFGLMRTLRDLLERSGGTVMAAVEHAEAAPAPAVEPAAAALEPDDEAPIAAVPGAPTAPRRHVKTQEDIEDFVVEALRLDPAVDLDQLAAGAYGPEDKRARTKLTWTLKGLATRGLVERLSASTWRALGVDERDDSAEDEESDAGDGDDDEERDVG
jgi:hypothetical protein